MVNVEIDGKQLEVSEGAMVIEAADDAGIYIPRFCYHKKLSIAANCRMCLVDVEKVGKALPACATPVTDGMVIHTRSEKAMEAQKSVMEFLLINHPLDCPICDQGGECELQDIAMGYGSDVSKYSETKRVVPNKDFGPLIAGDMTRCIHCTRCVRFGEEIAGVKELGATGRGEHMEIGTFIQQNLNSELSGNVIDLCPVGALTAKPSRFAARAWEMVQHESIAPHDCIGSNVYLHTFRNKVVRAVPRENEAINETWLSDRDRFSYEGLNSGERLTTPMVKVDGQWQETDWDTALHKVVGGISKILSEQGAEQIGAISSPSMTLEEQFLLQKLVRGMGSNNVDHRIGQTDVSDQDDEPLYPWLGQSIADLESNDAILLIGSDVRHDQPIAGHRIRKAALAGANIMAVNPLDYDFNFDLSAKKIASPAKLLQELGAIIKALANLKGASLPEGLGDLLTDISIDADHEAIARQLSEADNASVILGLDAFAHPQFASLRAIANQLAKLSNSKLGYLSLGSNGAGAALAGAVPHRGPAGEKISNQGMALSDMLAGKLAGYLLLGVEAGVDFDSEAMAALDQAQCVVSMSAFCNDKIKAYSDVLLPIAPFSETSGTFVNAEGRWQSFEGVVQPPEETRPAWKVLRVLGNLFECEGFDYVTSREVRDEVRNLVAGSMPSNDMPWRCPASLMAGAKGIEGIPGRSMYAVDALVRRADSLQRVVKITQAIRINQNVATHAGLSEGEQARAIQNDLELTLPVMIDERVPDDAVIVPANLTPGSCSGEVTLSRV